MRAVIFTGGSGPTTLSDIGLDADSDYVIAADSGLELANRFSITPDCIVGDFDSLSDKRLLNKFRNADVKRFETAKDYTDTEIALEAARDAGADDIVLVGGGGGRLDHLVGILALFHRTLRPNRWITDRSIVQLITSEHEESGEVGRIVSFFPLSTGRSRMASHGLRWPLDELEWRLGDAGVSNEFIAPTISIAMKEGALLMIMPMQDCL